jgi:hypothetical protein
MQLRIRSRTSDYWIRIREAQRHTDPDPQHCQKPERTGAERRSAQLSWGERDEGSMPRALIKAWNWKVLPSLAALAGAARLRLLAFQLLVYM